MVSTTRSPVGTLRSMTGYADARGSMEDWSWSADIRSVNGRGLDLRLRLPDWVTGLEPEVRKLLQSALVRGNVSLNIRVQRDEGDSIQSVNEAALQAALKRVAEVQSAADAAGVQLAPASAADLLAMRGVVESRDASGEETGSLKAALVEGVAGLIEDFNANRAQEGAALAAVLADQLGQIETLVARARALADDRLDSARAAMERGLARLLEATEVPDEARLRQEMALLAVKNDVTEEMDRLDGHIAAARTLMTEGGAVGRKFDFLMQEFNREANTLCSKAQSQDLTAVGLDLKAVIDQMREQVQNLE